MAQNWPWESQVAERKLKKPSSINLIKRSPAQVENTKHLRNDTYFIYS